MNLHQKLEQFLIYYHYVVECDNGSDKEMIKKYLELFPEDNLLTKLTEDGVLSISPSSEIEAYALMSWMKSFSNNEGAKLMIRPFINGDVKVCEGVKIVYQPIKEKHYEEELENISNATPQPIIDVNKERKNQEGFLVPSDDVIFFSLSKSTIPLTTKEVTEIVISDVGQDVQLHNVLNALNRLFKDEKLQKLTEYRPLKWLKKTISPADNNLYASGSDRIEFSKDMGYKTIDEAISELGSWEFEKKLKDWKQS